MKSGDYLNGLLDNLEKHQLFDLKDINNEILKAISLLIFKGDDIEKLYKALEQNYIKDYRIAFGLWGALFGFSAIPKTISNVLFEEKTIDIQNFLKDMYKKIHNFDIKEDIQIDFIQGKVLQSQVKQDKSIKQNIDYNTKKFSNNIPKCPKCGADMVLKEPKSNDTWKPFYGCSKFKETGCKGSRDLNTTKQNNNFEIINIYEHIKEKGGIMKLSEAKKVIKIKTNKEFKEKYNNDDRFEFYKERNTEMIRIK